MDQRLLDFAGFTPEQFTEAMQGKSDDVIADWFRATATLHSAAEIEQWNEMMLTRGPDTPEKWDYFKACRDAADPSRTDIATWVDLLDLEEKRLVPQRTAKVGGGR